MNRWDWLEKRLAELGYKKNSFAAAIGWESQRVYELFGGSTKAIPIRYVPAVVKVLNLEWESFLRFNTGKTDEPPKFRFDGADTEKDLYTHCLLEIDRAAEKHKADFTLEGKIKLAFLVFDKVRVLSEEERDSNIINLADVLVESKAA